MPKFKVTLARSITETVEVEVEATSDEQAQEIAERKIILCEEYTDIPAERWELGSDTDGMYVLDVEAADV